MENMDEEFEDKDNKTNLLADKVGNSIGKLTEPLEKKCN